MNIFLEANNDLKHILLVTLTELKSLLLLFIYDIIIIYIIIIIFIYFFPVQSKALAGAKSFGSFLYSAVNKAGKTVSEASAKIKETVEKNVSSYV